MNLLKHGLDTIATFGAKIEPMIVQRCVSLPNFPRHIQLDGYSCGAQCALAILKYYGKTGSIDHVMRELGTTIEGTDQHQLRALFKKRGLIARRICAPNIVKIKNELINGYPILVSMNRDHWAVVYGYAPGYVFVADPALNRRLLCRHSTKAFLKRWDKWAMAVRG